MTDPAEIRAEGRRLREALWWTEPDSEEGRTATAAWSEWLEEHADVLLADPAPVRLTEAEREVVEVAATVGLTGLDSSPYLTGKLLAIIDRLSAAPVDDRLAELEDWLLGAEHHAGCSGEYKNPDGAWAYRCKCGLRELRDERLMSPSVDPEEKPDV